MAISNDSPNLAPHIGQFQIIQNKLIFKDPRSVTYLKYWAPLNFSWGMWMIKTSGRTMNLNLKKKYMTKINYFMFCEH